MESYFTSKKLFNILLKWKIHIAVFVIIAGIMAVIFSSPMFIEPKYESYAVLYPAVTNTFSEESETEQMLEILSSTDIMFKLIDVFDLPEHYEIEKDDPKFRHRIVQAYSDNVNFKKTPNEAVIITVRDKNPEVASDMVDSIIKFYNDKLLFMNISKTKELVYIYQNEKDKKMREVDSLGRVVTKLRQDYGLLYMPAQIEKYTEAVYLGKSLPEAREILGNWRDMGAESQKTDSLYFYAIADYQRIKFHLENAIRDTQKFQTYTHIISSPFPADKKVYPVRWVITFFSMFGAFLISLVLISFVESTRVNNE
jgi:capsular polysaccharide biosynthesis protein